MSTKLFFKVFSLLFAPIIIIMLVESLPLIVLVIKAGDNGYWSLYKDTSFEFFKDSLLFSVSVAILIATIPKKRKLINS
jgi:hypothetical protein